MAAPATAIELVCGDQERFWACLRQHFRTQGQVSSVWPSKASASANPACNSITSPWETRPGTRWPAGSKKVNPHALFVEINGRGGFFVASQDKKNWWEVAKIAGVPEGLAGTLSYQVKLLYEERLL
ncbi:hypothetical protein FQN49_002465 [Arthroderma sp. PD_2]|nr:hypothetical protein FQN49_002465 [Arthroderma sp. PD_2]